MGAARPVSVLQSKCSANKLTDREPNFRGRSSVVERHVANVNVEGSTPFARFLKKGCLPNSVSPTKKVDSANAARTLYPAYNSLNYFTKELNMAAPLSQEAINQIYINARTYSAWLPKPVSDETLRQIYDLAKLGPTSANSSPARFVFVKSPEAKEKLISSLMPLNVDKVKAAPVTAIVAMDTDFYEHLPRLFPHADMKSFFTGNKAFAEETAFRNSSLQGAYLIVAARAMGLDVGPMSGFDKAKLDEAFFKGTTWKSNFILNIGYGDPSKLHPRLARFTFDEACKIA
jgi:3-hydroxypropanoate dehydrogenase